MDERKDYHKEIDAFIRLYATKFLFSLDQSMYYSSAIYGVDKPE